MDDLGNRIGNQTQRDILHNYYMDPLTNDPKTNRYSAIDAAPITHDEAGNMTQDRQGYVYFYDYENRIVRIENGVGNFVASFDYDALGHRIRKMAGTETTLYYNDPEWRVLAEYDAANNQLRKFIYGNYLDETLRMTDTYAGDGTPTGDYYFLLDHLYSPAVLLSSAGAVIERYEFDSYGTRHVFDQNFGTRTNTNYGNYIAFQGHIHDRLDNGNLNLLDARYRTYDPFAGRWLMHEKLGMIEFVPNHGKFTPIHQYGDSINLYLAFSQSPIVSIDPMGLTTIQEYHNPGTTGHAGLLVDGADIDFGPRAGWSYLGDSPTNLYWKSGDAVVTDLSFIPSGRMMAGPNRGKKCCELNLRNAAICIKYVAKEWDGTYYHLFVRNCRDFVIDAKWKCCLIGVTEKP